MVSALERQQGACYPVDFCHLCANRWAMSAPRAVTVVTLAGSRYRLCPRHAVAFRALGRILRGSPYADRDGAPSGEGRHQSGA